MATTAALILTDGVGGPGAATPGMGDTTIAGLTMTERAALAAHHSGIDIIHLVGAHQPTDRTLQRLRSLGVKVSAVRNQGRPFEAAPTNSLVVVIPVGTVVEPRAVTALLEHAHLRPGEAALAIDTQPDARYRLVKVSNGFVSSLLADGTGASTDLTVLTPDAVDWVRKARSGWEALWALARAGRLRAVSVAPRFCERLDDGRDRARLEHEYIRHANGGDAESFFTKQIRRLSVPVTRQLLRLPLTANHVTLAGLLLSLAAGFFFAIGAYWAGLVGAAVYYASTVLDGSDGEVARAKYCESPFGCWLETAADYASYVFAWAGITTAALRANPHSAYSQAAIVAVTSSVLTFALAGYLRHRVARANPGRFDDALAATLAVESPVHRFSGWARQWIKRSCLAHLLVFLAVIGQLNFILFLWAFGASAAFVLGLAVHRVLVSRVTVPQWRAASVRGAPFHA